MRSILYLLTFFLCLLLLLAFAPFLVSSLYGQQASVGQGAGGTCTNQAVTAISTIDVPTCATLTAAFLSMASPTIVLGTAAAAGSATTLIRSDATIAAFDATAPAVTTPLALGTTGSIAFAARRDHTHQSPGGIATITSASGAINTTDTAIVSATIPANFVAAGTSFRLTAYGTCTSTVANASNFRVRWGAAGTSSDTVIGTITTTAATSGTTIPFYVEFLVTFQSTTVAQVQGFFNNNGVTGVSATALVVGATTNTTALTTTSNEIIHLDYLAAATTTTSTFNVAAITVVKM